jgi:penicillin amidase
MQDKFAIRRDAHGIPHVAAADESAAYRGQGVVHATDRALQLLLMRILGQGRAAELLDSGDAMVQVDLFFRRMNWCGGTQSVLALLSAQTRRNLEAYCAGVNDVLQRKFPWEFKLLGYRPAPWLPEDCILLARMIGYLTLAQSQAEIERLLVEMVQAGIPRPKLEELFPGQLGGLDVELLKQVTLGARIVAPDILWEIAAPRPLASNNWVVAGSRTATGRPLLANDPHLEVNRLPNVWCEVVLSWNDRFVMGGSMPGLPGVLVGRNPDLAWGATYAFVDACDSWVERCRDGQYYRGDDDKWLPFRRREEEIRRRKGMPHKVVFYENDHGVLDGDPLHTGYYLATRWAPAEGGAGALEAVFKTACATSVEEGMQTLSQVESAWNWVLADKAGGIAYQMSGRTPQRREGVSGLVPLPGWLMENDWQGFVAPAEMPQALNPPTGFIVTANNDLNALGQAHPINVPMGAYRAERIRVLLSQDKRFTVEDMQAMHGDLYSVQAARFIEHLAPLLPDTPQGAILREWDCRYDAASQGAFLFERFYQELYREVFGRSGMGLRVIDHLAAETGVFVDFYANFDRVLLAENSVWFEGRSRSELYRLAAARALEATPRPWGQDRRFMMNHILLGGKLPAWCGFDRGPLTGVGGRATVHQGQIYRSDGRLTTFMPSFRFVVDLAEDGLVSNLAGGPSDRRFSRWYVADLDNWLQGRYKTVCFGEQAASLSFP